MLVNAFLTGVEFHPNIEATELASVRMDRDLAVERKAKSRNRESTSFVILKGLTALGLGGLIAQVVSSISSVPSAPLFIGSLFIAGVTVFRALRQPSSTEVEVVGERKWSLAQWIAVGFALIGAFGLVGSALVYSGRTSYLVNLYPQFSGEDSAKWVNVVSDLSTGGHVGLDSVGGFVTAILGLAYVVSMVLCLIVGEPIGTVGSTTLAVAVAQWSLIALAPLALLPMVGGRVARGSKKLDLSVTTAFASVLLTTGSLMAAWIGHLTAQIVLVGLVFGASVLLANDNPKNRNVQVGVALFALIVMSSWLPLQPLVLLGTLVLLGLLIRNVMSDRRVTGTAAMRVSLAIIVGLSTIPQLRFIFNENLGDYLAAATGGTNSADQSLLLILGVVLASLLVVRNAARGVSQGTLWVVWSILAFHLYGLILRFNDIRVNTSLNYGSTKYLWILSIGTVAIGVVLISRHIEIKGLSGSMFQAGALVVALALPTLGSSDHMLRWVRLFDASRWEQVDAGKWYSPEVVPMNTPIELLPIGCVVNEELQTSVLPQSNMDSYLCSRFLASASGMESIALIRFGLGRIDWSELADEVTSENGVLARDIIVIDRNSRVLGRVMFQDLFAMTGQVLRPKPPDQLSDGSEN